MKESWTTWRGLINLEMCKHNDSAADIVCNTLSSEELDEKFGGEEKRTQGKRFCLWTATRVYFPAVYDGHEWCASVARFPDKKPVEHVGGGGDWE